jgi:hypothetical protein
MLTYITAVRGLGVVTGVLASWQAMIVNCSEVANCWSKIRKQQVKRSVSEMIFPLMYNWRSKAQETVCEMPNH